MNRFKLFKAGVNAGEGVERFNGDAEMYEKYLKQFPESPHYGELCAAVEAGDVKRAFLAAHALKGVAGNLSLEDLYTALTPLVEELRADSLAHAGELIEPVRGAYERVIAALVEND